MNVSVLFKFLKFLKNHQKFFLIFVIILELIIPDNMFLLHFATVKD